MPGSGHKGTCTPPTPTPYKRDPLPLLRLHYAIQAYKELLLYIQQMCLSKDVLLCDNAKVIQSNIFYHPEYRDVFVTLLRNFYEVFQSKSCLRDIIEATHVYFRQMEHYCSENSHLMVRERRHGKKKKKGGQKKQGKWQYPSRIFVAAVNC